MLQHVAPKDDMDEAELPSELHRQMLMMRRLFIDRAIFTFPGLTKVMLETLAKPRTFIILGRLRTIGSVDGVSADVQDACLRRMQTFARLASQVFEAEFPNFTAMASFRVFALSSRSRGNANLSSASENDQETCLRRLAQTLNIAPADLIYQFRVFEPYAGQVFAQRSCSNLEAWAQVVKQLRNKESDALLPALTRYAAWTSSSCECERTFAITSELRRGFSGTGGRGWATPSVRGLILKSLVLIRGVPRITLTLGCRQLGAVIV